MRNLFNLDNPFVQFLARVGDLIIVNVLFVLCCLPVVTAGASIAAMHKVTQAMALDEDNGIVKTFFRAFRENFKQATAVWMVELIVLVSLVCDWLLVMSYFDVTVMYVLLGILAALVVCVCSYMIHLLVRYQNTLRQHLSNALILSVIKLPKTIVMVFLNALPIIVAVLSLEVFWNTLIFWLTIGFSFVAYMNLFLLKPIYTQLEGGKNKVSLFM